MKLKTLIIFFVLLAGMSFIPESIFSQCTSFTKKKCMPELLPYIHNGQMNTVTLGPGESASTKASFYSGQEYRIFICPHKILEGVYFEVLNSENVMVYSSKDSKKEYWDFNVKSTQELSINVFVPPSEAPNGMVQSGCISMLIGFKE